MKSALWVLAELVLGLVRFAPVFAAYFTLIALVDPWIYRQNPADQPYLLGMVYGPFAIVVVIYLRFFHRCADPIIRQWFPFLDREEPVD